MSYEGEVLTYTPSNLDFSVVYAVIVRRLTIKRTRRDDAGEEFLFYFSHPLGVAI